MSVCEKKGGWNGRAYLVAGEWVAVVLVAYQALVGRVELSWVSGQVGVLLVWSNEEKRCILACCDTVRAKTRAAILVTRQKKGRDDDDTDSNTSMPISG